MEITVETKKDRALRFVKANGKKIVLTTLGITGVIATAMVTKKLTKPKTIFVPALDRGLKSYDLDKPILSAGEVTDIWLEGGRYLTAIVGDLDWRDLGDFGEQFSEAINKLVKLKPNRMISLVIDAGEVIK